MQLPERHNTIQADIDRKIEEIAGKDRYHLGVSILGHVCDRFIWLTFRNAVENNFNGRMMRLFQRGHREEETIIAHLRIIGCVIDGQQTSVVFSEHVSGSCDGIIKSGLPGAEKTQHVLEIKTHNDKSFRDLKKNGVEKSKPAHYVQMQCYMLGLRIDRGLYFAVNKNDDEYYTERLKFDGKLAEYYIERGIRLSLEDRIPPPISESSDWYQCKLCNYYNYCHGEQNILEHCRTCEDSYPTEFGWYCGFWHEHVPKHAQYKGCGKYKRMFGL